MFDNDANAFLVFNGKDMQDLIEAYAKPAEGTAPKNAPVAFYADHSYWDRATRVIVAFAYTTDEEARAHVDTDKNVDDRYYGSSHKTWYALTEDFPMTVSDLVDGSSTATMAFSEMLSFGEKTMDDFRAFYENKVASAKAKRAEALKKKLG